MKKIWMISFLVFGFVFSVSAQEKAEQRGFIGVAKCKTCHRTAKQGEQFKIWEAGPHAKAFETLASEAAKKIAAEKKIADAQKADECLQCHATGYVDGKLVDKKYLGAKFAITDGVGCESCHGAGADYNKMKPMKAIMNGEVDGATLGLVKPDEKTCITCHNEKSPTYKEFKFAEMVKEIAHPIPDAKKAKYKKK